MATTLIRNAQAIVTVDRLQVHGVAQGGDEADQVPGGTRKTAAHREK